MIPQLKPKTCVMIDDKLLAIIVLLILFLVSFYFLRLYYRKRLAREIARAQKSEHLKSVFLANVSHALRTPLNSIIGFSDLMLQAKKGELNGEQTTEMLTHINKNGHQLLYFISQLLELSNFEGSMLTFSMIEVNLAELMASYRREALRDTNPNVSIRIRTELSQHCKATLDTNLMHQLMMHLLMNAAKHTSQGSITINYGYERKGINVSIVYTGIGQSETLGEDIFAFLQREGSLTLVNEAADLGLSICRAIIEALNGELDMVTEDDKKTIATFWFPCQMRDRNKGL